LKSAAPAARQKIRRSGGAGRKGGWGERNSRPALAFSPPQFFVIYINNKILIGSIFSIFSL